MSPRITFHSSAIAQNVGATFTLPSNLILDTGTSADTSPAYDSYVPATGVITWSPGAIGNIAALGGTSQITVKAKLKTAASCSTTTTQIQGDITFGCPTSALSVPGTCNSSCSANPPYHVTSGVISTPTITNVIFTPTTINSCGTGLDMSITFNTNQTIAQNVNIKDTLPNGYQYDSAVSITGTSTRVLSSSPTAGDIIPTWIFSSVTPGNVTINFKIKPSSSGSCPTTGSDNSIDINYQDTCSVAMTQVSSITPITVTRPIIALNPLKSTLSYFFSPTNTTTQIITNAQAGVKWEVSFKNTGDAALVNTTIQSVIGSSFNTVAGAVSSNGETPVVVGNTATWSITSLAAGSTWTATVTANHIGANDTTGLTNVVTIDGSCPTGCKHQTTLGVGTLPYSHTTYVSLLDTTNKVMSLASAVIGEGFSVTLTSSFSGNGSNAYTNVLIKDVFPKDVSNNPLMKINSTPVLKENGVDQTANWDYIAPNAGNNWVASWSPKATYTFITPTTVTVDFNAYINDVTPGVVGLSQAIATNVPKRGDILINQNLTTYTFQTNNYTQSKNASITVKEPFLTRAKVLRKLVAGTDGVDTIDPAQVGRGGLSPNTLVGGDELIGYRLTLTNTNVANISTAYDVQMLDVIPVGMRANPPVLAPTTSIKLNNVVVPSAQYTFDTSTVAADGKLKINFLKTNGFTGIPAGQSLVITYYCKVDSNITGFMTMVNSLYLVKSTPFAGRGNEGYSSLPSDDPNNALDRMYGNTTAMSQTVKTPSDAIKITKSRTTEFNENGLNTTATQGEKITYTIVMSTVDSSTGLSLKVSALTPTVAPLNTFRDIIPDGIEVDQTNSTIVVNQGTTTPATAPVLSYLVDVVTGQTTVSIPAITLNPNTIITVTIIGKVKDMYYQSPAPIVKGDVINNGGNGVLSAHSSATTTALRWFKSDNTNQDTFSLTLPITIVEPNVTLTSKTSTLTKVAPGGTVPYTIILTSSNAPNTGTAHNVTLVDTIPIGMRSNSNPTATSTESTAVTSKTYDPATGKITWFWSTLAPNTVITINYNSIVDDNVSGCSQLINEAQLGSYSNLPIINPNDVNLAYRKLYSPTTSFKVPVSIGELSINPVHNMTGTPGSVVIMPHTINTCINGTIMINDPVSTRGWPATVYQDLSANHDGSVLSATPLSTVVATAGTPIYIAIKEQIPQNAASSLVDNVKLSISQTVVGIALPLTASVTDTINASLDPNLSPAGAGTLKLVKKVDKPKAFPGDTVTYTIDYTNAGTEDLDTIVIEDITPESTHLASVASFVTGTGTVSDPGVGGKGPISWTVTGVLKAGQSGQVTFSVVIE